jgi:predicted amidohydrolase
MGIWKKFKAAAVQAAPVFLNPVATTSKACRLIREAAESGADLIVFPEVFVAGYPYWNWIYHPLRGSEWFTRLYHSSIDVSGPEVAQLCETARALGVHIAIGINERAPKNPGTIFNTNLLISPVQGVVNRQRKLVPTFAEKLSWTPGDGTGLRVTNTPLGPIGMLACGENTNTLARFTLLAEGELIHVANFIAFPFVKEYDMPAAIRLRCGAHAFEGKVFSIVSCSAMSEEIVDMLATNDEERRFLTGTPNAYSAIFGPDGQIIGEPVVDVEGITYADIDLDACIPPKQFHDIIGHYNRADIFRLRVDRNPQSLLQPVEGRDEGQSGTVTFPVQPLPDAAE